MTSSDFSDRNEYRQTIETNLTSWCTEHRETELFICADSRFESLAMDAVVSTREILDDYIMRNPEFGSSFAPVEPAPDAPEFIADMCRAARAADVGPMAAVAGAFAAQVGMRILEHSAQVIVENGGDIFMKTDEPQTVAIFAGASPLSMKIGITADSCERPLSVCTSSGTVGPSVSFGRADAAVVVAYDACLADACATRLGNELKTADDIARALELIHAIPGVIGAVAVVGDRCGAVGDIQLQTL